MKAEEAIRARLAELEEVKASYLQYLHVRIKEEDWHGAWDCAVNLSEVSCGTWVVVFYRAGKAWGMSVDSEAGARMVIRAMQSLTQ